MGIIAVGQSAIITGGSVTNRQKVTHSYIASRIGLVRAMLKINRTQMDAFEVAIQEFEDGMVEHLREFSPWHSHVIGEPGMRQFIRKGISQADSYGFTERGPVRFYIELSLMFGISFDTDPQLPWTENLKERTTLDQTVRINHLYDAVMDYINAVAGPDYKYVVDALRRAESIRFNELPGSSWSFADDVSAWLRSIYPQKCDGMGEPRMRLLIQRGIELANIYSVSTDSGTALFVGLAFAFGHGFPHDPRFPSIASVLRDGSVLDVSERVRLLYSETINYLSTYIDKTVPTREEG